MIIIPDSKPLNELGNNESLLIQINKLIESVMRMGEVCIVSITYYLQPVLIIILQ